MASKTGRAGYVTINSVAIPITKWTVKGTKELAISTDSNNWDVSSGQLYRSQLPGELYIEGTMEGYWDSSITGTNIIAKLKSDTVLALVLQYDRSTNAYAGNFDLSDVETSVEVPGASMISFTANFKSNGVFTTY